MVLRNYVENIVIINALIKKIFVRKLKFSSLQVSNFPLLSNYLQKVIAFMLF